LKNRKEKNFFLNKSSFSLYKKKLLHSRFYIIALNTMENLIQYNDDNTVNVPFGRVAEWYTSNHLLLKSIKLKSQSRKNTSELVKKNIITVSRVEGAVDYIECMEYKRWEYEVNKQNR
jgi:site-specific DNA-adenine methylase